MAETVNVGSIQADVVVDTDNAQKSLRDVQAAAERVAQKIRETQDPFQRLSRSSDELAESLRVLAEDEALLASKAASLQSALNAQAAATSKAGDAARNFGRGMIQIGYIVDDMRYGAQAVLNNIAPLVTAFGGGPGLAGAVQVAGIAAVELYQHLDDIKDLMGIGRTRTEAEEMELLAKNTSRTAEETAKLNKYKREQADIAAMMVARPEEEEKAAKDVGKAVQNADIDKVFKGVAETLAISGRGDKLTPEERAEIEAKNGARQEDRTPNAGNLWGLRVGTPEDKAAVRARQDEAIQAEESRRTGEKARSLVNAARTDPGKLKELITLVESNPGAFPEGFGDQLKRQLPENRKERSDAEKRAKDQKGVGEVQDWQDSEDKKAADARKRGHAQDERIQHGFEADARAEAAAAAKQRKEAREKAEQAIPGLDAMAERATMEGMIAGNPKAAQEAIRKRLARDAGLNDEDAGNVAEDIAKDARQKVGNRVASYHERDEGDGPRRGPSQVYASNALSDKIQSAIGGQNEPKKHTSQFDQIIKLLADQNSKNFIRIEVK